MFTTHNRPSISAPIAAWLRQGNSPSLTTPNAPLLADSTARAANPAIRCGPCDHPITWEALRIKMNNHHFHRLINPQKIEFLVGCFSQASGCLAAGQPFRRHSWFIGYQWQIALCRGCGAHLGWYFTSFGKTQSADSFFTLIIDRLRP